MAVYTVHEPPRRDIDPRAHTDRFVFVRDRFSWAAALLGPFWMLRHRLWLECIGYLVILVGLIIGLLASGASANAFALIVLLFLLLIGLEASSLRRWALERRGWINVGVVIGDDLEAAERRFFDAWAGGEHEGRVVAPAPATPPSRAATSAVPDVIGLFPQPGARP